MSLREAAKALLDDYDSIELEEGSYKVVWPQMEALRAALAEAPEPYAYLVVQASGFIVGAWRDRETAEAIAAKQLARDAETVVPVVLAKAPRAESAGAEPDGWIVGTHPPWIKPRAFGSLEEAEAWCDRYDVPKHKDGMIRPFKFIDDMQARTPKAEPVDEPFCYYAPDGTFRKHMRPTRFSEWPWSEKDYVPLYKHPPARAAELSDEEIIALMPPRLREWHDYGPIQRATVMDFARAIAAARGKG